MKDLVSWINDKELEEMPYWYQLSIHVSSLLLLAFMSICTLLYLFS